MYRPLVRNWKCLIETSKIKYMKNTNPKNKKILISKDYQKGFLLDSNGYESVLKLLKDSKEVYCLNTEDYSDETGSVTITIHFTS